MNDNATFEQKAWFTYGYAIGRLEAFKNFREAMEKSGLFATADTLIGDELTCDLVANADRAKERALAWTTIPREKRNCANCVQLGLDSDHCIDCYGDAAMEGGPMPYTNWRPPHPDYMETDYIRRLHAKRQSKH